MSQVSRQAISERPPVIIVGETRSDRTESLGDALTLCSETTAGPVEPLIQPGLFEHFALQQPERNPQGQRSVISACLLDRNRQPSGVRANLSDGQINGTARLSFQGNHSVNLPSWKCFLNF